MECDLRVVAREYGVQVSIPLEIAGDCLQTVSV